METQGESSDQTPQTVESESVQPASEPVSEAAIPSSEPSQTAPAATPTAQTPASEPLPPAHPVHDLLTKARAAIQGRKSRKLEKILELLSKKPHITNDDVEKLLHVSDATATRYLTTLKKQGKIIQVGTTGKAVTYMKV